MRWVSAILLVAMAVAMVLTGPPVATARGGVRVGVGVNLHLDRVSLDGFLICDDDSATPAARSPRVRRVELLTTPNAAEYVDRITAAARVLRVLSRIGLHHWWQHATAPFASAED